MANHIRMYMEEDASRLEAETLPRFDAGDFPQGGQAWA
jgi:hypothetical protein